MSDARAWVGCLACYNGGTLRGEWVDGNEAGDFVPCHRPGHEEWWVMDHEGYEGLLTGECSPSEAQAIAELIDKLESDHIDVAAYAAFRDNYGTDYATPENFEESFEGEHDSMVEFAQQQADDMGLLNDNAQWPYTCIDWDWAARELRGDYWTANSSGGVYVFRNI